MTDRPSQELLDLYDKYAHGIISRRDFFLRLKKYAVGGATTASLAAMLMPQYASAQQVRADDERIKQEYQLYQSPKGAGEMRGLYVEPVDCKKPLHGVVVIHENRGLNPHIEDVARRVALAGYAAFAPDALYPLGGYPGNDDDGRDLQRKRDRMEMLEDFVAAADHMKANGPADRKIACVGFCFGGAIANYMAVRMPDLAGAVPFYGGWPNAEEAADVRAPLLIHLAGLDQRINDGWPDYETALKANNAAYETHVYDGVNHGFHNDTTPRYDEKAAKLAWERTLAFFEKHLS